MTDTTTSTETASTEVSGRLSTLDRFLPVWIGAAMVARHRCSGTRFPDLERRPRPDQDRHRLAADRDRAAGDDVPGARQGEVHRNRSVAIDRRSLAMSLVLNWLIGPALMFTLAWLLLPDLPEYRTGLIIVGLARCIAMVLIWNDLACGSRELAAVLVAINSLFQIVAYSLLGYFYLELLPGWLGLDSDGIDVTVWEIAKSVLIFLGIPLLAGFLTRTIGERAQGDRVVRGTVPAPHRPDRSLRAAVHHRDPVRAPGRTDHQPTLGRRPHRDPAPRLLRDHVDRRVLRRAPTRVPVRTQRLDRVHRRRQQLRAGDRRVDRRIRRRLRPSTRRRRRAPHRGSCPRRPRLCLAVGTAPLLPGPDAGQRRRRDDRPIRDRQLPRRRPRSPARSTSPTTTPSPPSPRQPPTPRASGFCDSSPNNRPASPATSSASSTSPNPPSPNTSASCAKPGSSKARSKDPVPATASTPTDSPNSPLASTPSHDPRPAPEADRADIPKPARRPASSARPLHRIGS